MGPDGLMKAFLRLDDKDSYRALLAELRRKDKDSSCILVVDRGVYDVGSSCKEQGAMLHVPQHAE